MRLRTGITVAITAAGLIAGAVGGVAAQEDEPGYTPVVEVSGTSSMPGGCTASVVPGDEATPGREHRRFICRGSIPGPLWSMSDPRLEGTVLRLSESSRLTGPGVEAFAATCDQDAECDAPVVDTQIRAFRIENERGAWQERPRFVSSFPGSAYELPFPDSWMSVLDGEGDYEGLVAVLQVTHADPGGQTYHGYIIDAELLPPMPETAGAE